ncbi:Ubiquitin carboxyl-terminal hydrolase isozyme L5 [Daldinia childiae]|uniref:Ubiquitin carboxyl-terminal hydrolase isozyme L5 n=1 Tax=Daldinia childiae TaxID=326645 RepID=UPI0014471014|nr:Ubiquitin carboxyl-terminal hydrolase isozyme L5 [Daldinia childiae]KAF3066371.1 Ubiquitin carboxyl-terminal hydrolase isozyme L5 [Daldinia childiae]
MAEPEQVGTPPVSPDSVHSNEAKNTDTPNNGTRRSGRATKAPTKYDEEYVIPAYKTPIQPAIPSARPKRKAALIAKENIIPEDPRPLLEAALDRMSQNERKEYGGWVELESEPGFFNAILQELEAKDFKVQEVYSLDPDILEFLPKPVHGLIFLFQYDGSDEPRNEVNRQECPDYLWFTNQTTANACATVALMNIIMNAQDVTLGMELQKFRESTKELPPPHRGSSLDKNDFIRSVHNSVARRIDLLSEDLCLDNKYEESVTVKKRRTQKKSTRAARKGLVETNYHYIAYVPVNGQVWELDGFEMKPLCLGPISDSWIDTASTAIKERMTRNSEIPDFSLLAICQSPLQTLAKEFATSLACSHALHELYSGNTNWTVQDPFKAFPASHLAQRNLTREYITSQELPDLYKIRTSHPDFNSDEASKLGKELRTEQDSLDAQYVAELATVDEAVDIIRGRQRDYTPAIHHWVRALAEKGVLRGLIQDMGS